MTEAWAQIILTGILAWIAYELRSIKTELRTYVRREDCRDDMKGHCDRLNSLEERINANAEDLRELKGNVDIWHGQKGKGNKK